MKANITIKVLDLSWNGFADVGARAMGVMLRSNNVLTTLDLSNNRITRTGKEIELFIFKLHLTNNKSR